MIPKRGCGCVKDKAPFKEGDSIFSTLTLNEKGWERADYCQNCWENAKEALLKECDTFWKREIPTKAKTRAPSPDLKALELFISLASKQNDEDSKKLFILALYLERKKQIALIKEGRKGASLFYEVIESGETIEVKPALILQDDAAIVDSILNDTFG